MQTEAPKRCIGELSAWVRWLPVGVVAFALLYCLFFEYLVISWGSSYNDGLTMSAHFLFRPIACYALVGIVSLLMMLSLAILVWVNRAGGTFLMVMAIVVFAVAWQIPRVGLKNELTEFAEGFRDRVQKKVDFHAIQDWVLKAKLKPKSVVSRDDWPDELDKLDSPNLKEVTMDPSRADTMIIKWHEGFLSWFLVVGPETNKPQAVNPFSIEKVIEPGVYVSCSGL